jgi:signal transduction histidine kinase
VIGYTELIEEDIQDGRMPASADAAKVKNAGRHLLGLINGVLDLSKLDAERMELNPAPTDLPALLREVADTLRPMALANANMLHVEAAPEITIVETDALRLRQCLLNLGSNACKFTYNGLVTIHAHTMDAFVVFDVKDTGPGLNAEQAARLFQPFVQGDQGFNRKFDGAGLGLVITRKLAQLMGGDVSLVSAPGEGATFTLKILAPRATHVACKTAA